MGRKRLLGDSETVEVAASDTAEIGSDTDAIFRGEDGSMADKERVRIAVAFTDTPPATSDFAVRVDDTVNGSDLAIAIPDEAVTKPGTANAVDAGVWSIEGPIPSQSWLKFVNNDSAAHTISECVVYYQDV